MRRIRFVEAKDLSATEIQNQLQQDAVSALSSAGFDAEAVFKDESLHVEEGQMCVNIYSTDEISKEEIADILHAKDLYIITYFKGISEDDENVNKVTITVSDNDLYNTFKYEDENLAKGVTTSKDYGKSADGNPGEVESKEASDGEVKDSSIKKEEPKKEEKPEEKRAEEPEEEEDKEEDRKEKKEESLISLPAKLQESLINTFVIANNEDGTIVGLFKDEEKARLKAGSYNAITGSQKFVSCPFIEIRDQNYKFSKEILDKICDHFAESKKLKESKPEVVECKIYSYYAPYFLDGEVSGFTDDELDDCHALEAAIKEYTGCTECVDVKDDADFGDVRIPVGIRCKGFKGRKFLPGSVSTFVFQKSKKKALTEASKYDKKYDHYFPGLSRSANEDGTYKFSTEGLKDDNRSYFGGRSYTTGESPIVDKHNKAFSDEINKWANENYDNWIDSSINSDELSKKIKSSEYDLRKKFIDTDEYRDLEKKRDDAARYRDISKVKGWGNTEKKQAKLVNDFNSQIDQLRNKYLSDNEDKDLRKSYDDINAVYDKYRNDYWNIRKTHSDALDQELKDRRDAVEKKVVGKDFYSGYPKGTNHETPRFGALNGDYDDKLSFYYANGEKDGQKMYKRVGRNNHTSTPWGPNRGLVDYYASADPYEDFEDVPESDIENLNKLENWDSKVSVGGEDSTD